MSLESALTFPYKERSSFIPETKADCKLDLLDGVSHHSNVPTLDVLINVLDESTQAAKGHQGHVKLL